MLKYHAVLTYDDGRPDLELSTGCDTYGEAVSLANDPVFGWEGTFSHVVVRSPEPDAANDAIGTIRADKPIDGDRYLKVAPNRWIALYPNSEVDTEDTISDVGMSHSVVVGSVFDKGASVCANPEPQFRAFVDRHGDRWYEVRLDEFMIGDDRVHAVGRVVNHGWTPHDLESIESTYGPLVQIVE